MHSAHSARQASFDQGGAVRVSASEMGDRLIVGLDLPSVDAAEKMVRDLDGVCGFYKIGYRLAFAGGLEFARDLAAEGKKVFLDLKLLDIDNTVAEGVESIVKLGVTMLTLHAYPKAMRAAVEAARGSDLCLLGVTVLTSMDQQDLVEAGYQYEPHALVMRRALTFARDFGALVMHETQDPDLASSGVMNEGLFASWLGLPGIPREAEAIPLERDLLLARLTGSAYHAAKISTAISASAIARAKNDGAKVSAGVSINHLSLNENDVGEYRTFFRLSPPLRSEEDRLAMVEAVRDGTIDIIVSSHDPQDVDTKRLPFADAADGAIGLETLLGAALRLHHNGDLPLLRIVELLSTAPARLFGLPGGTLAPGSPADLILVDLDEPWVVREADIRSRSKNTCFEGARLQGRVLQTMVAGRTIFSTR